MWHALCACSGDRMKRPTISECTAVHTYVVIISALIIGTSGCAGKTSDSLYQDGVQLLREGKTGAAKMIFKNALEKNQHNLDARYQLARLYQSEKKYELAEKEFHKVKLLNPHQPDVHIDLAALYVEQGNIGKARILLTEIVKNTPANKRAIALLSEIDVMTGKAAEGSSRTVL